MPVKQDIWTFLETYSVVQGYLLSIYAFLFLRRYYLGALLSCISTLILAHLYYHFRWYMPDTRFIFLEAPLWYVVGPLFYLFILNTFHKSWKWTYLLHFIPFICFFIFMIPFYLESGPEKLRILKSLFGESTYEADVNRYIFSADIFLYILLSYITFKKASTQLQQVSANSALILDSIAVAALKYYLLFSLLGLLVYVLIGHDYGKSNYYYGVYYLGLSLLIHLTLYFILIRNGTNPFFEMVQEELEAEKYLSSPLSEAELQDISVKVLRHISDFHVYRNQELRLRNVADELKVPAHHISQAVNQVLRKSFFDLINEHRIEGIKRHYNLPKYENYTLMGIASEYGFKSSSSFYRIFKKYTGKTPKEYFGERL